MAGGGQDVALHEAAELLGVSTAQLNQRIEAGELPEAIESDDGQILLPRDQLPAIAQREGWIIDLRVNGDEPSPEFSEMLERLLGLGQQLIDETSARKVAEADLARATEDLAAAKRKSVELEAVIEDLEAENVRLGKDLSDTKATLQISDALANERFETILDLQAGVEQAHKAHQVELEHHRRQEHDLRDRIEKAQAAMGWWSRRRYLKR
jgi:chromosome segregation ATPase